MTHALFIPPQYQHVVSIFTVFFQYMAGLYGLRSEAISHALFISFYIRSDLQANWQHATPPPPLTLLLFIE